MKQHLDKDGNLEYLQVRCKITGSYKGISFEYNDPIGSEGSQFIWVANNDPSEYWWTDGNMSCDCNRAMYLPDHLKALLPTEINSVGGVDFKCGEDIDFYEITPLEGDGLPILEFLNNVIT